MYWFSVFFNLGGYTYKWAVHWRQSCRQGHFQSFNKAMNKTNCEFTVLLTCPWIEITSHELSNLIHLGSNLSLALHFYTLISQPDPNIMHIIFPAISKGNHLPILEKDVTFEEESWTKNHPDNSYTHNKYFQKILSIHIQQIFFHSVLVLSWTEIKCSQTCFLCPVQAFEGGVICR